MGRLRSLPDAQLNEEREAVRQQYLSRGDDIDKASQLYDELHRYDEELIRRTNEAYARENPNPPEPRHREHGWYLSNDV